MERMTARESIPHCQAGEEDSLDLFIGIRRDKEKKGGDGCNIVSTNNNELPIIDYFGDGRIALWGGGGIKGTEQQQ